MTNPNTTPWHRLALRLGLRRDLPRAARTTVRFIPALEELGPKVVPATLTMGDADVAEGNGGTTNANFTVRLSASVQATVTVGYSTADGTARAGQDYQSRSGTLTFRPGETVKTVSVPVTGDVTPEADETFAVRLSSPRNATIADGTGQGIVLNDDAPQVALSSPNGGTLQVSPTRKVSIKGTAQAPGGISHVWVELYKGAERVGYIYQGVAGSGVPASVEWTVPATLGGHVLGGDGYRIKWIAWDNTRGHVAAGDLSDNPISIRPAQYFVENVPDIMRNFGARQAQQHDRDGWAIAESFQRRWFNGSPTQLRGVDDTSVRMDWVLRYDRANTAYDRILRDPNFNSQALVVLRTNLVRMFNETGQTTVRFGDFTKRRFLLHDQHIQHFAANASWSEKQLDGLEASLGTFNFYVVPQGTATRAADGSIQVAVEKIGIYAHDTFSFASDNNPFGLGYWKLPGEVSLRSGSGFTKVDNAAYRAYQSATGQGGDFFIFSDVRTVTLAEPLRYTL